MRRIAGFVTSLCLTAGLVGVFGGSAAAQTADLAAFCAARLEGNDAQGKAANLAVMNKALGVAPPEVVPQMTALRDAFQKKGEKLFDTEAGIQLIKDLDSWVYDNCPGTKVEVTATDYQYAGMPESFAAGPAQFKMTNAAPKENHMMAIVKLKDAAQGRDLSTLLKLPEKKQGKYFEESGGAFLFAPAGQSFYAPANLEPGEYAYVCFLPVGGKDNGKPHFTKGMYGSFTVS